MYRFKTSEFLEQNNLSLDKTYFLLVGSYADKWFACSMLVNLLELDPNAYIISSINDGDLVRIFFGSENSRCLFAQDKVIQILLNLCQQDPLAYLPGSQNSVSGEQISSPAKPPRASIRSSHIVNYPYFTSMVVNRYLSYCDALKTIMFLTPETKPQMPKFYTQSDKSQCEMFLEKADLHASKSAIINVVNISHQRLPLECYANLELGLASLGYKVAFNVAGARDVELLNFLKTNTSAKLVDVPGYLMKIIYDRITLCIGAVGGAMSIADAFSSCHMITYNTPANFFPRLNLINENPFVKDNMYAYPRPNAKRISEYYTISMDNLRENPAQASTHIEDFNNKLARNQNG